MTSRLRKSVFLISICIATNSNIFSYNPQHLAAVKEYSRRLNAAKTDEARQAIVGDFSNFDLSGAALGGLNLTRANFTNANFNNTDLSYTKLNHANLQGASFVGASSYWITFLFDKYGEWNTTFEDANLTNANLTNARLVYCNFKNSRIINATTTNIDLRYSDLSNSVLDGSNLQTAQLTDVSLDHASLVNCGVQQPNLAEKATKGNGIIFQEHARETINYPVKLKHLAETGHVNDTYPQENGKTLLHCAAEQGNIEVVRYLLDNGANINPRNIHGETPLILATRGGHENVAKLLLNINFVRLAVSQGHHGFDINELVNGKTLLHIAASHERANIIRALLLRGADKHKRDTQGRLPICDSNNNAEVESLLRNTVTNRDVTFKDIVGSDDTISHLTSIIRLFKTHKKGMPGLILFEGPPGTGKTFLANAFAHETGFNFIERSASSFSTSLHGGSEQAVREVFDQAISRAPCVIFLDEIDSLAAVDRGIIDRGGGALHAIKGTLNTLLTALNAIADSNKANFKDPLVVIGATNFASGLDKAFRDRAKAIIKVQLPTAEVRKNIIEHYLKRVGHLSVDENFSKKLSQETKGFSARQIESLIEMAEGHTEERPVKDTHFVEPFDNIRRDIYGDTPGELLRPLFSLPVSREEAFRALAGMDDITQKIDMILDFLRNPERYSRVGARLPRAILLEGPPGTGKTSIAKALAMAGGFTFLNYDTAKLSGGGIHTTKNCFDRARLLSPSIIFIDEIDSLGSQRTSGSSNSLINTFLSEMQGFNTGNEPVIVIGTTNRASSLDEALLDRFEHIIQVPRPSETARKNIIKKYLSQLRLENESVLEDTFLTELAKRTEGLSSRKLDQLINYAGIIAGNHGSLVTIEHVKQAIAALLQITTEERRPEQSNKELGFIYQKDNKGKGLAHDKN